MSYLMTLPAAERAGQIMRFAPDYWQTDFNLLTSASLVSEGGASLVFRAIYRRNLDLAGAHWSTEDRAGHLLHRYEAQPSYRGCTLRFRYRASGDVLGLDAFNGAPWRWRPTAGRPITCACGTIASCPIPMRPTTTPTTR